MLYFFISFFPFWFSGCHDFSSKRRFQICSLFSCLIFCRFWCVKLKYVHASAYVVFVFLGFALWLHVTYVYLLWLFDTAIKISAIKITCICTLGYLNWAIVFVRYACNFVCVLLFLPQQFLSLRYVSAAIYPLRLFVKVSYWFVSVSVWSVRSVMLQPLYNSMLAIISMSHVHRTIISSTTFMSMNAVSIFVTAGMFLVFTYWCTLEEFQEQDFAEAAVLLHFAAFIKLIFPMTFG